MTVVNTIRRFLIKRDPTLKPPKISENLCQPLEKPNTTEVKG
jgi:hypothetical protein